MRIFMSNSIVISDHFSYEEVIHSDTAISLGIDNNIYDERIVQNARAVANNILEPIRSEFGPLSPNSWFRSEELEFNICAGAFYKYCESRLGRRLASALPKMRFEDLPNSPQLHKAWQSYFARKQHPKGMSVDFEYGNIDNKVLFQYIKNFLEFDQLILEFYRYDKGPNSGWVHCSFDPNGHNRNQAFEI